MKPIDPRELRLQRYLDGELASAERAAFETELACSAELQAELARLRRAAELARQGELPEPSSELHEAVRQRLGAAGWGRARRRRLRRAEVGALAAVMLVTIVSLVTVATRQNRDVYVTVNDSMTTARN